MQHFWIRIFKKWCSNIECIEASSQQYRQNKCHGKEPAKLRLRDEHYNNNNSIHFASDSKKNGRSTPSTRLAISTSLNVQIAVRMQLLYNLIGLCFFERDSHTLKQDRDGKRNEEGVQNHRSLSLSLFFICRKCPHTHIHTNDRWCDCSTTIFYSICQNRSKNANNFDD